MFEVVYRALVRASVFCALLVIAGGVVAYWRSATDEQRKIAELQAQKEKLEQVVARLTTDKRVADLLVTDQKQVGDTTRTTLLLVEYDRNGKAMAPREFVIEGTTAHVEAMVIEFEKDFVMAGDPLKGHAIALFTRIFGDQQTPASAERIDTPGKVPAFYRSTDPAVAKFEIGLWEQFWTLESDPKLREKHGVKVAVGKGVWGPFEPDQLYTITLTPDGNLSRTVEPIRGVYGTYIQLLRSRTAKTEQD